MRKLFSIILFFVFGVSWGQEVEIYGENNSVYWKITHPQSKSVSYLFGTIHLIDKENFLLPEIVENNLRSSEVLFLELDNLSESSSIAKWALLPEGKMTDLLDQPKKDSVYAYVQKELGLDSTTFEKYYGKFKPFFFAQLSAAKLMMGSRSYDKTFNDIAKETEMPIIGLETMEEQIAFFDEMSDKLKVELIMSTIRNSDRFHSDWLKMQQTYLEQNITELVHSEKGSAEMNAYMEAVMMKTRNINWVQQLTLELKKRNAFIAVGAAHLIDEFGLIALLRKAGFVVEPIKIQLTK